MSKFCHNCGNEIQDMDVFCEHCGMKQAMPKTPEEEQGYEPQSVYVMPPEMPPEMVQPEQAKAKTKPNYMEFLKKNPKIIWICAGVVAATILLVVILAVALSDSPYKSTLDNYFSVAVDGDYEKIEKLAPEEFWEYVGESYYDMSAEEAVEYYIDSYEDYFGDGLLEEWEDEFGRNVKFSYKIVYENKLSERKLNKLQDTLKEYGIRRKDVKQAYEVEIEAMVSGSKDEDMEEIDLILVNIDNGWYVVTSSGALSVYWDLYN